MSKFKFMKKYFKNESILLIGGLISSFRLLFPATKADSCNLFFQCDYVTDITKTVFQVIGILFLATVIYLFFRFQKSNQ